MNQQAIRHISNKIQMSGKFMDTNGDCCRCFADGLFHLHFPFLQY